MPGRDSVMLFDEEGLAAARFKKPIYTGSSLDLNALEDGGGGQGGLGGIGGGNRPDLGRQEPQEPQLRRISPLAPLHKFNYTSSSLDLNRLDRYDSMMAQLEGKGLLGGEGEEGNEQQQGQWQEEEEEEEEKEEREPRKRVMASEATLGVKLDFNGVSAAWLIKWALKMKIHGVGYWMLKRKWSWGELLGLEKEGWCFEQIQAAISACCLESGYDGYSDIENIRRWLQANKRKGMDGPRELPPAESTGSVCRRLVSAMTDPSRIMQAKESEQLEMNPANLKKTRQQQQGAGEEVLPSRDNLSYRQAFVTGKHTGPATHFVSHAWDAPFWSLLEGLLNHQLGVNRSFMYVVTQCHSSVCPIRWKILMHARCTHLRLPCPVPSCFHRCLQSYSAHLQPPSPLPSPRLGTWTACTASWKS